jgi:hypothetical protein
MTGQNFQILIFKCDQFKMGNQISSGFKQGRNLFYLVQGGGMSGFNYYTHYIFRNDECTSFKEEVPKLYLKNLKEQ